MTAPWLHYALLTGLLALAMGHDLATRRIPNRVVAAGLVAGLASNALGGFPVELTTATPPGPGLGMGLLGALTGLCTLLPFYVLRTLGAGDVKLMAAVGAFFGPAQTVGATLLTFMAGGVLALGAALGTGSLPRVVKNLYLMGWLVAGGRNSGMALADVQTTGRLPYSLAIAAGSGLQVWLASQANWAFK